MTTKEEFIDVMGMCRQLFINKMHDYGTAWRILRPCSLTDQIFIKANRIRTLQETGHALVDEGIKPEFIGIVNYCIMALIQLALEPSTDGKDLPCDEAEKLYDEKAQECLELMLRKNHDYGEAWRSMRISSYVDLILMKIFRTKQIEDLNGQTLVSEGIAANYMDMLNYSVFGLIQLKTGSEENEK